MDDLYYYTKEELAEIRRQLVEKNRKARELRKNAGHKLHPRIAEIHEKRRKAEDDNGTI